MDGMMNSELIDTYKRTIEIYNFICDNRILNDFDAIIIDQVKENLRYLIDNIVDEFIDWNKVDFDCLPSEWDIIYEYRKTHPEWYCEVQLDENNNLKRKWTK